VPKNAPTPRPHESSIAGGFGRSIGPTAESAPESGVVAGRLQDPLDTAGGEDAVSHNEADDVASNGSFFLRFLTFQHEQLCVGRQHFADGVLKLPSRLDPAPHLLDPILGDMLDLLFSLHHKGQRPDGMAAVIDTMAGRLAAAEMRERERARESVGGDRETSQQLELALTQSRSEWSIAPMDHLNVYIP